MQTDAAAAAAVGIDLWRVEKGYKSEILSLPSRVVRSARAIDPERTGRRIGKNFESVHKSCPHTKRRAGIGLWVGKLVYFLECLCACVFQREKCNSTRETEICFICCNVSKGDGVVVQIVVFGEHTWDSVRFVYAAWQELRSPGRCGLGPPIWASLFEAKSWKMWQWRWNILLKP